MRTSASCNCAAWTRAASDWKPDWGTCPWWPSRACQWGTWCAASCFRRSNWRVLASAFFGVMGFFAAAFFAVAFFAAVFFTAAFLAVVFLAALRGAAFFAATLRAVFFVAFFAVFLAAFF